jgi:hypothetical protein
MGHFPTRLTGMPVKPNHAVNYLILVSFLLHAFTGIRIKVRRIQESRCV